MSDKDIKKKSVVPQLEPLESRTLYSADVAGLVFGGLPYPDVEQATLASDLTAAFSADSPAPLNTTELVFVDAGVRDYDMLVANIRDSVEPHRDMAIYVVESDIDGVEFISGVLSSFTQQVDAVHILSHGADATVTLGTATIDSASVNSRSNEITSWGNALSSNGDIAFYGCDLASTEAGEVLIDAIADLTGADVAASVDLTGNSQFNADWDLEYRRGDIETAGLFSDYTEDDWDSVLAVINVSTTADVVDASAADLTTVAGLIANPGTDGEISLREAIIATNADAGADEINLLPATYTISLSGADENGDFDISDDLVIRGAGSASTKIDGAGIDRVIDIDGGVVDIEGLTISAGKSPDGEVGGGLRLSNGSLTLSDVNFTNNVSTNKDAGGLYADTGTTVVINDSVFFGNTADPDGAPSYKDAGAFYNLGVATLERVTFDSNTGDRGGAIHNHGTLNMTDVWLVNNTAASDGGGIDNHGGDSLTMDRVTFELNTSGGTGGGLNTDRSATLHNVTFSANTASMAGGALQVSGGGTSVEIENSTFSANKSSTDGGAISSGSNNITLTNSLFADNVATGTDDAIDGNVSSLGNNLIEDSTWADGIATDIVGKDPLLGPLQNNGGYVKTHELLTGSPAINAGGGISKEDATGLMQDQFPDIGAYESRQGHSLAKLYWTDQTNKEIYRANEDGSAIQTIVSTTETPFDIEVDIVNRRIYWTESAGDYVAGGNLGSLFSADLDGANKTEVVGGMLFPTGIALDVANGHVYLANDSTTINTGGDPFINEIVRYNLDGTNPVTIASGEYRQSPPDRIVGPTDVEYDPTSQRLYWSDRGLLANTSDSGDEIKLVDLSAGTTQVQVIGSPSNVAHSPAGLTVLPGGTELYWANTQGISFVNYDTSLQSENRSAALTTSLVIGVQYHAANDEIYLTDQDGSIKTVSKDLTGSSVLFGGLDDPAAIAVASSVAVSLSPVIDVNSALTVLEGSAGVIDDALLQVVDDDTADTNIEYTVTSSPVNGRLSDATSATRTTFTQAEVSSGQISYLHYGGEDTSDSFTFSVSDGVHTLGSAVFTITVTPQNDLPVALPEAYSVNEGATVQQNLSINDSDAENRLDLDGIVITSGPANGSVLINGDGTIDYTHNGSETTSDLFRYTISDLDGGVSNIADVSFTITPQNDPPIAVGESYTVSENSTTTFDLVANDTDIENSVDPASIAITGGPSHGSITINGDGTVDYTHDGSEIPSDSFTYTIDDLDGATSNSVAVTLTITPQNDTPVAVVESFTVNEASTSTFDLSANDIDAENRLDLDSIVITGGPSHGSVTVNGDGTVDYIHDGTETTSDSFSYTIADLDGATSGGVTVALTITPQNDPPVAVIESFTVNEGSTTTIDLAANDTDAENQLDLDSVVITGGPLNGSVTVNGDGTVDYVHNGTETISDSFSYTIADLSGAVSNAATVSLSITPQNDAPVAIVESFSVAEGSTTTFDLAVNDIDAENRLDAGSIVVTAGPSSGSLMLNGDGTVDYTHDGTETASDNFSYTIGDLDGAVSNAVIVSLTITPVNDVPVAVAESFTVDEGSVTTFDLALNDTDAENRLDLDSIAITGGPANGSLLINGDGTVDYAHDGTETTADSFSYTIADLDGATSSPVTVNLTITPLNDRPVAVVESFTIDEGSTTTFDLAANDTDAENRLDAGSIVITTDPANGSILINGDGTVDYTHNGGESNTDSFSYTIQDLDGATSTAVVVSLTINPVNDSPVAVVESFTVNEGSTASLDLAANDTDAENRLDPGAIAITGSPVNGSLIVNGDGTVDYTHDGTETTSDSFRYTIMDLDGATSNAVTVSMVIAPQNDPPVAMAESFIVDEGSTTRFDLAANDSDAENRLDVASIAIATGPLNGSVSTHGDGSVDYIHDGSETVSDSFGYTVMDLDGAISVAATVSLTITPKNDAPVAVSESFTIDEGSTTTFDLAVNDVDAENRLDLAGIAISADPSNGALTVNGDGTVNYSHDGTETITDGFTYTITDLDGALSNPVTVGLTISPQNDLPVAVADTYIVDEGSTTRFDLTLNDSDAENRLDLDSLAIATGPQNGSVIINGDGSVGYTHDGGETITDSFSYTIMDLDGATSVAATVGLTVTPQNDSPVAVDENFTVAEGSTTTLDLAVNDTDAENRLDQNSVSITVDPVNGSVSVNGDGSVGYTHDGSETVSDSFSYTIMDLEGAISNAATVGIVVTPQNDPPVAVAESFMVDEGSTITVDLAVNDLDVENRLDPTTIAVNAGPSHGSVLIHTDGTVDYTHNGTETSFDSFSYTIMDLDGATSNAVTTAVAIIPQNDTPVANNDSYTVDEGSSAKLQLAANDVDAENKLDLHGITIKSSSSHGTVAISSDGTVIYSHDGSETVTDGFSYSITDLNGATSNVATVSMEIVPQNDAPVASPDTFSVEQGASIQLPLATNDDDIDSELDPDSIQIVSSPASGSIVVNGDGTVDYVHNNVDTTPDSFSYTIRDQQGVASIAVVVELVIIPRIDEPVEPEIAAIQPTVLADDIRFIDPIDESVDSVADKPDSVIAPAEEQGLPAAQLSEQSRARADSEASTGIRVDSMEAPRDDFGVPVERSTNKSEKRVVELEPVVENNPLRELFKFDEEQYSSLFRGLIDSMEGVKKGFDDDRGFKTGVLASSAVLTSSLAVGYALWIVRGGALLMSFMATMPAWRFMDPFPILGQSEDEENDDTESLQSIVREKQAAPLKDSRHLPQTDRWQGRSVAVENIGNETITNQNTRIRTIPGGVSNGRK